jgi:hypothetical protein
MDATFQDALQVLDEKFREAEASYPGLKLDVFYSLGYTPMTDLRYRQVCLSQWGAPPEADWFIIDDFTVARIHGNPEGLERFQDIGDEAHSLLCDTDPFLCRDDGYRGWLGVLHHIRRFCPAEGFELMDCAEQIGLSKIDPLKNGLEFAPGILPFVRSFFQLSSAAIGMFLQPYLTRFLRPTPTRVVLMPWQLAAVFANARILRRTPAEIAQSALKELMLGVGCLGDYRYTPHFVPGANHSGKVVVAGQIQFHFKATATAFCVVLQEFEDRGWPREIATPPDIDEHDCRGVITALNRKEQKGPLRLRFTASNSGSRISWEIVEAEPDGQ